MIKIIKTLNNVPPLYYREDTYDKYIIKEQMQCYKSLSFHNTSILDVGANIGSFARFALANGATRVFCYEPEPDNFTYLNKNKTKMMDIFPYAVMEKTSDVEFFLNKGINKGIHSAFIKGGRGKPIIVKGLSFSKLLTFHKPSLIKVDIEGGEFYLPTLNNLPSFVKQIAIELHLGRKQWKIDAVNLTQSIKDSGFELIVNPVLDKNYWATMLIGRR